MISIYDVLKASKGIHVDDTFAELWGRKLSNAYTVATYTGTLPATLKTVEGYLESYKIYGNTIQAGTPTPENPIVPSGCGELEPTGVHAGQYKLPILSNSTVTDIYLGESQTTRWIKKLVLTGEETMSASGEYEDRTVAQIRVNEYFKGAVIGYCNTLKWKSSYVTTDSNRIVLGNYPSTEPIRMFYLSLANSLLPEASLNGIRTYLQQQYSNGTPVTIWHVLAEPETGIVNEPLMKIGDYADTIDSTQTSARIPTVAGTTVIDYNGTPKPDKVELTYRKPKGQ